jgi:tRNA 2-thiouridine synthesizing protein A
LRLKKALAAAPGGARLRLLADDPMARIDVQHFAEQAGVEIVAIEALGAGFAILIRKPL